MLINSAANMVEKSGTLASMPSRPIVRDAKCISGVLGRGDPLLQSLSLILPETHAFRNF